MARSIWKGAISFGLVHIPVALQSATSSDNVDFDWLDERSMDPVGYKRVNKVTGKEVKKENIVKGIQYEKGKYILLSEDEIKSAHPKTTQTIDIFSFVNNTDIPLTNIDTPYYLAPDKRGEKVYALLRETLIDSGTVGLASVILHTKQHLAAVMPIDSALVLILLRWPNEVRSLDTLELTKATTDAELSKSEKEMAKRLVQDMKGKWDPEEYRDTFKEKIMALVDQKVNEGKIENVETNVGEETRKSADIIDLTELLKRSLGGGKERKTSSSSASASAKKPEASKTTGKAKTSTAKKSSTTKDSASTKKLASSKPKRVVKKTSSK
ncbi:MAG: Ku protein [Chitinophagaceae bacterium]|nr:MAG: Ku protein [Chitinophagaceae bacterium]